MYVNDLTRDYGDEGRQAVRELLTRAHPDAVEVRWVE
jgi:predicted solute-binding protein